MANLLGGWIVSIGLQSIKSQAFKDFLRIVGEIEGIPGLVRMVESGQGPVDFRGNKDPVPSEQFGEITELPLELGWYQEICDRVPYPRLILTVRGWTLLCNEEERVKVLKH